QGQRRPWPVAKGGGGGADRGGGRSPAHRGRRAAARRRAGPRGCGLEGAGEPGGRQGQRPDLPRPRRGQHRLQARRAAGRGARAGPDPPGPAATGERPVPRLLGGRHRGRGRGHGNSGGASRLPRTATRRPRVSVPVMIAAVLTTAWLGADRSVSIRHGLALDVFPRLGLAGPPLTRRYVSRINATVLETDPSLPRRFFGARWSGGGGIREAGGGRGRG